jgi:hypothetical protein
MSLYTVDEGYTLSSWYDHVGAFDQSAGTDLMLNLTRQIIDSDAYMWQGIAFPVGTDVNIGSLQTFSGTIVVPPFSYVVQMSGFSGVPFAVRIYDKGAQTDIFYRQFAFHKTVVSNMQLDQVDPTGQFFLPDQPFAPYMLKDPLIILPPGILQVQITNMDNTPSNPVVPIQLLLGIAMPKNTISLNNRRMQYPTDPTGTQTLQALSSLIGGF